ncbi:hypothetical protein [Candidatus Rariloculus sp.]|uniref:hypothetical protein n=1 Tax=Candidatus Rariloculus sp. TaxID=3101265 RepID=UPI003D09E80E
MIVTNGLPEAAVSVRGSPPSVDTQKWLTALPVIARPDIRDMLVVGFGGGVALFTRATVSGGSTAWATACSGMRSGG